MASKRKDETLEVIAAGRSKKDLLEEIESLEEQGDFYYTRTEVLLFLLCQKLSAVDLAALVSQAKYTTNEMLLRDLATTGLEQFVRHLILDLMQTGERERAEKAKQREEET